MQSTINILTDQEENEKADTEEVSNISGKGNPSDTCFQNDPVSLIKGKKRILRIEAARRKYHLPVVEEEMMTVVVVMRNQTEESYGILKTAKRSIYQLAIISISRPKTEKGWWPNG